MFNHERHSGKLLITCVILFIFMLSFFIAFLVEKNKRPSKGADENIRPDCQAFDDNFTVCRTPECHASGKFMSESMNFSTNPCDDFYEYACGNWLLKNPIPYGVGQFDMLTSIGNRINARSKDLLEQPHNSATDAVDKAKIFYQSCMYKDKTGQKIDIKVINDLLATLGGWPLIMNDWIDSGKWNWWAAVATVKNNIGKDIIYGTAVKPNILDTSKYSLYMQIPAPPETEVGLKRMPNILLNSTKKLDSDTEYHRYIQQIVCYFTENSFCGTETVLKEIREVVIFDQELQTVAEEVSLRRKEISKGIVLGDTVFHSPNVLRSDDDVASYIMKVKDMKEKITGIDWETFVTILLKDVQIDNINEIEVVAMTPYLQKISDIIKSSKYSNKTVANYIGLKVAESLLQYASGSGRAIHFRYARKRFGVTSEALSAEACVESTKSAMGFAVTNLYASSYLGADDIAHAKNLITNIRAGFLYTLSENDWLDKATKERAMKKLNMMEENVGFPLWNNDPVMVNKYYQQLTQVSETDFLKNALGTMKVNFLNEFSNLKVPVDRKNSWPINNPLVQNSFYYANLNNFYLVAGIMGLPIFSKNNLEPLNYGGIGYVIGHEVMHGFDDSGAEFDEVGQYRNWWSTEAKSHYKQRASCMSNQYTIPLEAIPSLTINGTQTLGENIADNGGIKGSYWGYKAAVKDDIRLPGLENISGDKLFFISAAQLWCTNTRKETAEQLLETDDHSPAKYRVNIPFGNSEEFSKAFKCHENTNMNIKNKCVIF